MKKSGQCMCGAVKFTAANVPEGFNACYCDMCRRWTGGRFMGVHIANDDFTLTGESAVSVRKTSEWAERAFCNQCGSPLWYQISEGEYSSWVNISAGLFDDTEGMKITREFFADCANAVHDTPTNSRKLTSAETLALFAPVEEGPEQ